MPDIHFVMVVAASATNKHDTLGRTPSAFAIMLGWSVTILRLFAPGAISVSSFGVKRLYWHTLINLLDFIKIDTHPLKRLDDLLK